jgi:hypothetical protein
MTEAQARRAVERYSAALAKIAESEALRTKLGEARAETWGAPPRRPPVMLHPTQFRDMQSDACRTIAMDSPHWRRGSPRGVCVGLALAGWAS